MPESVVSHQEQEQKQEWIVKECIVYRGARRPRHRACTYTPCVVCDAHDQTGFQSIIIIIIIISICYIIICIQDGRETSSELCLWNTTIRQHRLDHTQERKIELTESPPRRCSQGKPGQDCRLDAVPRASPAARCVRKADRERRTHGHAG